MINILYTLIIFPIEQVIEICFFYGKTWFGSLGVAVLGMSIAVSTFVLPVYLMAEKQQRRQRELERSLKDGADRIKSVFKGDERFMLLSTYYRQNNYHPVFALRNSLDLLIQIPFFIAAYHFLHNLEVLKGAPFLFIADLGSPDKLLFGLNVLPIAMTVINVVSGMIYAKDLAAKDKIQLYVMAGVFLALLYNSPAGLVLYWTCNNIYNLVKNITQNSLKNKKREELKEQTERTEVKDNALNDCRTFILSLLALALLMGLVIPSGVISSGIGEFSYSTTGKLVSPIRFVIHTVLQTGGFFLWGICLYFLFQGKIRAILTTVAASLLIMSVMGTFVYWKDYGFLTQELVLSNYYKPWPKQQNTTLAVIIALAAVTFFLMSIRRKRIIISILFITVISFAVFGITDVVKTHSAFARISKQETATGGDGQNGELEKVFKFSKNGKNVIFFMLDRAQSLYVSHVFAEKPELLKSFQGFTFYPNTVAFGGCTMYAAQTLFGGYYYAPAELQKRSGELLKDKYNKAVQVLPRIMAQNEFDVVAANLPFADESEAFAKKMFDDADNIKAIDISNRYIDSYYRGGLSINADFKTKGYDPIVKKNLFQFSLFKCSPYAMRTKVYNHGNYMNVDGGETFTGNYTRDLLKQYIAMQLYPDLTQITDDNENNCTMILSDILHEPDFLQYPDYEFVPTVTNRGNGILSNEPHYHITVKAFLLLEKWFEYLKQNDVWDNTKIVIVSDHGCPEYIHVPLANNINLPNGTKLNRFNSLLMVKDFNAANEFSVDSVFMTNADVPNVALKDIVENPVDPFTQKPLYTDKDSGATVTTAVWKHWSKHGDYKYNIGDDEWLRVRENVFKKENWTKYSIEK